MERVMGTHKVAVGGDVTIDWNVAHSRAGGGGGLAWNADDRTRAYRQPGGAALLAQVIGAVADKLPAGEDRGGRWDFRSMPPPEQTLCPGDPRYHHSYALWSADLATVEAERGAWRVQEFLGLGSGAKAGTTAAAASMQVAKEAPDASLVVLDDAGLGFRDHPELWPAAVKEDGRHPWILLKMARPVATGALWERLHASHADRLVVVLTVGDLRLSEVQISRELSWERTAQDLAWELVYNPRVNALSHCAHLVVSFSVAGALLFSGRKGPAAKGEPAFSPRCRLFFDPAVVEGEWEQAHPGGMIGYTTCLAAGLARQLMLDPSGSSIEHGVQVGLAAMRRLHVEGYGRRGALATEAELAFPLGAVVEELARDTAPFAVVDVQDPAAYLPREGGSPARGPQGGWWAILQDRYKDGLDQVARRIVLEGVERALEGVPLGRFGKLLTVDRREIEAFRSIRTLIAEYSHDRRAAKPVSIAVFGAPGSGKSFGITQAAESMLRDQIATRTFNLSQFSDPSELLGAFHQVRDLGLSGKLPLVFWDEFDTALEGQPLGWLRHFLAPMQDGAFQDGQISHPIGRAIFIFAGGTAERMERFGAGLGAFREVKGPDFVSRLKGYVDILGPNRQKRAAGGEAGDPYFIIRRAILLRSILHQQRRQLFRDGRLDIDPGVLRAFLETRTYRHGTRSIESIVAMSLLSGKTRYERSSLPAASQLDLHVDAQDFLALVQRIDLEGEALEALARAAHAVYSKGVAAGKGAAAVDYDALPEHEKMQNRGTVRDIATKLAHIGYVMVPARSHQPPFDFPDPHLDLLAEMEHDRWLKAKLSEGWRWAARTDKPNKRHSDLVLWRTLTEEEKARRFSPEELDALGPSLLTEAEQDKDRDLVRGIPAILATAGYTVVRTREEETAPRPRTPRKPARRKRKA
jgi:RyR domain